MNNKREKFIFWLMGLGCGILLSGIIGTFLSLNILNEEFKVRNEVTSQFNSNNETNRSNEESNSDNKTNEKNIPKVSNNKKEETIQLYITSGLSATEICELLEKNQIIKDAIKFKEYVKKQGKVTSLRQGKFEFSRNMSDEEALGILLRKK